MNLVQLRYMGSHKAYLRNIDAQMNDMPKIYKFG